MCAFFFDHFISILSLSENLSSFFVKKCIDWGIMLIFFRKSFFFMDDENFSSFSIADFIG